MVDDESNVKQMFERAAGEQPSADDALGPDPATDPAGAPAAGSGTWRRWADRRGCPRSDRGAVFRRGCQPAPRRRHRPDDRDDTVAEPPPYASSSVAPTTSASVAPDPPTFPEPRSGTAGGPTAAPTTPRAVAPTTVGATVPQPPRPRRCPRSDGASTSESTVSDDRVGPVFDGVELVLDVVDVDLDVVDLVDLVLDVVDDSGVDRVVLVRRGLGVRSATHRQR